MPTSTQELNNASDHLMIRQRCHPPEELATRTSIEIFANAGTTHSNCHCNYTLVGMAAPSAATLAALQFDAELQS